jgi:dihydropyrimidinase
LNDLAIIGGTICNGFELYKANVYIKDGKISAVSSEELDAAEIYNANGLYVMPGLIDPHVHFALNLGKYTSADDFESGSVGAAFGGVTTYIDFLDPITDYEEFEKAFERRMNLASLSHVDYSFHTTIAHPTFSPQKLFQKSLEFGINSVKNFTTYSTSNRMTRDGYIFKLLKESSKYGMVATFHAENDDLILEAMSEKARHKANYLPTYHSFEAEAEAVSRIATFARLTNGQAYIVHNSSGHSVELLRKYGIPSNLRLETCPQYFVFDDSKYNEDESAALHALVPPLRSKSDVELMRKHFKEGIFYTVGTDHCPFKRKEKLENIEDYDRMPNGIGGVELSFTVFYNLFVKNGTLKLETLVKTQSYNVAETFGMEEKGRLAPGYDADIAIFDPHKEWTVSVDSLHTKSDYTPYEGMNLTGKFVSTIVRGKFVVRDEKLNEESKGRFVRRGPVFWRTR